MIRQGRPSPADLTGARKNFRVQAYQLTGNGVAKAGPRILFSGLFSLKTCLR